MRVFKSSKKSVDLSNCIPGVTLAIKRVLGGRLVICGKSCIVVGFSIVSVSFLVFQFTRPFLDDSEVVKLQAGASGIRWIHRCNFLLSSPVVVEKVARGLPLSD